MEWGNERWGSNKLYKNSEDKVSIVNLNGKKNLHCLTRIWSLFFFKYYNWVDWRSFCSIGVTSEQKAASGNDMARCSPHFWGNVEGKPGDSGEGKLNIVWTAALVSFHTLNIWELLTVFWKIRFYIHLCICVMESMHIHVCGESSRGHWTP